MNVLNVSVVIPTIINPSLNETLYHLNKGPIIPSEIILSLPQSKIDDKKNINNYSNIKFVFSKHTNQVLQRIDGFKKATNEYILQLDDDIIIDIENIKIILDEIKKKSNIAVSPSILNYEQPKVRSTWMNSPLLFNDKLYYFMMFINNGKKNYQPGKISLSGLNMNFDINSKKTYEVDWLPGGCILHAKKNIILDNYYPYKGKSYSEDLLLSALLKKNKIKLFHCTNSKSYFNIKNKDKNNILYIAYEIILNLRSMFYYNDTYGGSKIRLVFVIIIYYIWLFKYKVLSGKK